MKALFITMNIRELNDQWQFRQTTAPDATPSCMLPWLPATVPGHVHVDLMANGVIEDPFYRMHEKSVAWVSETGWTYQRTIHLDAPVAPVSYLVFEGLDTVAEIRLNGAVIASVDNMFVPHEIPVGALLMSGHGDLGDNILEVEFRSALAVGRERVSAWMAAGERVPTPGSFTLSPKSFVRKAQYMYGWDWGPQLVSCGIWLPVKLVEVPVARILNWTYDVAFSPNDSAEITVSVTVERADPDAELSLDLAIVSVGNDVELYEDTLPSPALITVPEGVGVVTVRHAITVDAPRRWWPNRHNPSGQGVHPTLYTVEIALRNSTEIESKTVRLGLRTIELVRDPDPDGKGEGFKFRVNGEDIFIKGANWIPSDSFPSRLENKAGSIDDGLNEADNRVYNLIWNACDAGMNMLRVWGGGLYESEHFYELCDEHGILVWQDFPFACDRYPDIGVYADSLREEATKAIRRLRVHPSLAIWCGNNENQMFYWEADKDFLGNRLYENVLPEILAAEDPTRPYWPGSSFGGDNPNSPDYGDSHNWEVWHGIGDWTNYSTDNSRFVSEFGFASSCGEAAWETCLASVDKHPHSPVVKWHDKTGKGYETYLGFTALHYPEIQSMDDLVYYTQINQADALKFGIEHYRRIKGRCWGTIVWQLNDCWPVQSWSMIDSEGEPKAAYFSARSFYAPVLLSLQRTGDSVQIHLTNDRLSPVSGTLEFGISDFSGTSISAHNVNVEVGANQSAIVASCDLASVNGRFDQVFVAAQFVCINSLEEFRNVLLLDEPKNLKLNDPGFAYTVTDEDDAYLRVSITCEAFAPYTWITAMDTTMEFEDNYFHLLPGETREVLVLKSDDVATTEELQPILRLRSMWHVS